MYSTDISAAINAMIAATYTLIQSRYQDRTQQCSGMRYLVVEVEFAGIVVRYTEDPDEGGWVAFSQPVGWDVQVLLDGVELSDTDLIGSFLDTGEGAPFALGTVDEVIAQARRLICRWLVLAGRGTL